MSALRHARAGGSWVIIVNALGTAPPQPPAGSPRPSPSPKRRKPDRQAERGFRVPSGADAGPGPGAFPHGGVGSHRPRGGTRIDLYRRMLDQLVKGNSA